MRNGVLMRVIDFFRDMRWGWSRTPFGPPIINGRTTTSQVYVDDVTALNFSAVWCATRILCGTGASLPLPIYRGLDDDKREKERTHPVYRALNFRPNPEQTAYSFRSQLWQWQANGGNAYAEIIREGNNPEAPLIALWPIHPSLITPKYDEEFGDLIYEYRHPKTGDIKPLEPWQVFHVPSIITYDGLSGEGIIAHARETIGAGMAEEQYGANFFGKGGQPQVVIEMEGNWKSEETRAAFRKEWAEIYGNPDAPRVAVLQGGAKAHVLNITQEDSQFLETRQFTVEEISRWYGIPPHMLSQLINAHYNNIESEAIQFVQYSLVPWLEIWEQCIWHKLLTEEEKEALYAEHNVTALLRGDNNSRSAFYHAAINDGWMNRNEVRKLENMDAVPGGDTFLVQGAIVPLDDEGKPESQFAEPGIVTAQPNGQPKNNGDSSALAAVPSLKRVLKRDLTRILTKESNRLLDSAKSPNEFVTKVDEFYTAHAIFLTDAVCDTFTALESCGQAAKPESFVASWIREGRAAVMEAAGTATPVQLAGAVSRLVESTFWTDRPERAVECLSNG